MSTDGHLMLNPEGLWREPCKNFRTNLPAGEKKRSHLQWKRLPHPGRSALVKLCKIASLQFNRKKENPRWAGCQPWIKQNYRSALKNDDKASINNRHQPHCALLCILSKHLSTLQHLPGPRWKPPPRSLPSAWQRYGSIAPRTSGDRGRSDGWSLRSLTTPRAPLISAVSVVPSIEVYGTAKIEPMQHNGVYGISITFHAI